MSPTPGPVLESVDMLWKAKSCYGDSGREDTRWKPTMRYGISVDMGMGFVWFPKVVLMYG